MSSISICGAVVKDILAMVLEDEKVKVITKPIFGVKRLADSKELEHGDFKSKQKKIEHQEILLNKIAVLEQNLDLVKNNLMFVSSERDHFRAAADLARKEGEKMARENNMLSIAKMELANMVEEQGKVCTVLAVELMEVVWSLSSRPDSSQDLQQVQMERFCNLVRQVVEQFIGKEEGVLKQEQVDIRLVCASLGTLVNFSGRKEFLVVMKGTEKGKILAEKVAEMMCSCQDQNLMTLGCMYLANILRAEFKFQDFASILRPEVVMALKAVVVRWAKGERTKSILEEVATKLGVLLDMVKKDIIDDVEQ